MRARRGRPNLYWPLVKGLENRKIYTMTQIVEKGEVDGFFTQDPFCRKPLQETKKEARRALVIRARRYDVSPDHFVIEGFRANVSGYYGWKLKQTFNPLFFTAEENAELNELSAGSEIRRSRHQSDVGLRNMTQNVLWLSKPAFVLSLVVLFLGSLSLLVFQKRNQFPYGDFEKIEQIWSQVQEKRSLLEKRRVALRGLLYLEEKQENREKMLFMLNKIEGENKLLLSLREEVDVQDPIAIIP